MTKDVLRAENKMGTEPIHRLLVTISLPIVISMLVSALYNIVDSIFVAQVSPEAFTALSLVFPLQNLLIAVGVGTGVGINATLSKSLGEGDFEKANKIAKNGVFIGFLSYIFFAIFMTAVAKPFMLLQTNMSGDLTGNAQNIDQIIEYGITYITICGIFSFGIMAQLIFEKLLQSTGKTKYIMFTQGLGAVINIILDPIMIFGFFGFPKLGVAGAAYATVIGQIFSGVFAILFNVKKNKEINISLKGFRPSAKIIREIYKIGLPSIILQSTGSVLVFLMNMILIAFSAAATAALGAYFKIQSFVFMPVFGFTNGLVPIVAYNYGAKRKHRITQAIKCCGFYVLGIMIVGFVAIQIFAGPILGMFKPDAELMRLGVPALRIISTCFIFAGFGILWSSVFQALGRGVLSMFTSICRQLAVLLPAAYLLSKLGEVNYIWWSFLIAELVAVIMSTIFFIRVYRANIKPLPDEDEKKKIKNDFVLAED